MAEAVYSYQRSSAGAAAYASELARLSLLHDRAPSSRGLGRVRSVMERARAVAAAGDFIRAVHVLGTALADGAPAFHGPLEGGPEGAERALARMRHSIVDAPQGPQRDAAERLLRAARLELSQRHWSAAQALIDEGFDRLAPEDFVRPLEP